MTGVLLSFQAAGLVTSIFENQSKMKLIKMGRDLEKAALAANLEAINYDYQESSINAMKELRQNLGTQIATNAARGVQQGTEGSITRATKSENAFNSDEQKRRMNLLAKEAYLRASDVISGLHTLQSETELGRSLTNQFNTLPVSSAANEFRRSDLGKKWGFGIEPVT